MDWNAGKINDQAHPWQGILWKAMHQALGQFSTGISAASSKIDSPAREDWLPERLSVFGISTLPPFFSIFYRYIAAGGLSEFMLCNRLQ